MKNETIKKINELGKIGEIICKIGRIILTIGVIFCLVGGILLCMVPKDAVSIELTTANRAVVHLDERINLMELVELGDSAGLLDMGGNTYRIVSDDSDEAAVVESVFYLSNLKWIMFACVIACVVCAVTCYFGGKLCAYFRSCETPFTEEASEGLMHLAWALIPVAVVSSLMESLSDSVMTGNWDITIGIDLTTVFLVLCVFLLAAIFKYGTELQTEADETL